MSNKFDDRIEFYKKRKAEKEAGIYHYIPFDDYYPRLSKYLPGIIPGIGYLLFAGSGIGKSKLFRHMFIQVPYDFIKKNPDSGLDYTVIINALEESKEELVDSMILNRLYVKYGIQLTINDLVGFSDTPLSSETIQRIEEQYEYFADLDRHIIIVNERNPFGFYKRVRAFAQEHGKFYTRNGEEVVCYDKSGSNLRKKDQIPWDRYELNNPNHVVVTASDHLWLYGSEGKMSKYETISHFSSDYNRQTMNLKLGFTTVVIQQQESAKEKKEFTFKGQSIVEKLEPSLDSLGDIKITQRDQLVIMALFSPYRYKIPTYRGYDVTKLKDWARFLFILKNRRGREGLVNPLLFNGAAETFEELPLPYEEDKLNELYEKLSKN